MTTPTRSPPRSSSRAVLVLLAHGTIFAHPRPRDPSRPVSLRRSEASGSATALRGSVLALGIAYDSACLQEATAWLNEHALAAEACHADGYIPSVWQRRASCGRGCCAGLRRWTLPRCPLRRFAA